MNMTRNPQSLKLIFGIAAIGLLSACATKPDFTNTANSLILSDDMSFKLAGYTLLRTQHEEVNDLHTVVREELLRLDAEKTSREEAAQAKLPLTKVQAQECPVITEKSNGGRIIVRIDRENCKVLPAARLPMPVSMHP